ncbi:MAG: ParB/RepB/Spo0J family partition protein, partial [Planctomycetia bacterium]
MARTKKTAAATPSLAADPNAPAPPAAVDKTVPLRDVVPSPFNPRVVRDDDPKVKELAKSIAVYGVLQPIAVRPHPENKLRYEILFGERRWRASRVAERTDIRVQVFDVDDHTAKEITVTENLQREDLQPLEEARGVATLLADGWDVETVADRLGKPRGWVARRSRLVKLSPQWQQAANDPDHPVHGWPATWLELVARLEPAAQDAFAKEYNVAYCDFESRANLATALAEWTREIADAPWHANDDTLLPIVGACNACPKRSSFTPGLFDDLDGADEDRSEKGDRCLDATCWNRKREVWLERWIEEKKADIPGLVLLTTAYKSAVPGVECRHDRKAAKQGDKGAVQAMLLDGPDAGTLLWVGPRWNGSAQGGSAAAARPRD